MNVIGLATRGYLCGGAFPVMSIDGPDIIDSTSDLPAIKGAASSRIGAPSLRSAGDSTPSIGGAKASTSPRGTTPTISGSGTDRPTVKKR